MNFEQAKALRLQRWRSALDNNEYRMQNPEAHRSRLHTLSAELAAEGLIDKLQQFDMDEMANAAYWHAVEELQTSRSSFCLASDYDVIPRDGGRRLGTIGRGTFIRDRYDGPSFPRTYDGIVYRDERGPYLTFCHSNEPARIEGFCLTLTDGNVFDLIETGRMIDGVIHKPIEDPDMYRALIDAAQVALENRDLAAHEKMRPLIDLARYCKCPMCLDRFDLRDECKACIGYGFIKKQLGAGLR